MKALGRLAWVLLLASTSALATTPVSRVLDSIKATGGTALTVPSTGSNIVSDSATQTLTNKTISGSSNTITNVSLTSGVTGTLPIGNGGTNLATTPTDGQLLIGKTSTNSYVLSTLTQGSGITITNGSGTITIASSAGGTATQEVLSTQCNGSTTSFTLANTPTANAAVLLYVDQTVLRQGSGLDYTISTATITLASACATGQTLYAYYTR